MFLTIKDIDFEPILTFFMFGTEVPHPYAPESSVGGGDLMGPHPQFGKKPYWQNPNILKKRNFF